jgi:DNA-directed RNA polymerase specialized sigma24 family protein
VENSIANILVGCRYHERKSQKDLYQLFHKFVFSICYRYDNQTDTIEQLVTESFVSIFKKLGNHRSNHFAGKDAYPRIQHWIRQITVLTCIEVFVAENKTGAMLKLHDELHTQHRLQEHFNSTFSHKQIIETIRQLPPLERITYNLAVIERMPNEIVAGHLNISTSDSVSILEKARVLLKNLLGGELLSEQNQTASLYYPQIRV